MSATAGMKNNSVTAISPKMMLPEILAWRIWDFFITGLCRSRLAGRFFRIDALSSLMSSNRD
ncbi:MAG: hypothetical protein ACKO8T_05165 [Actinomycetota bacterium]